MIKRMISRDFVFHWLRWILLIPISIGVGLLVSSIVGLILSYIVGEPSLGKYKHALTPLVASFLSVILAHWIAPKYKVRTFIVICSIWLLAILFGLFITIFDIKLYGDEYEVKDGGVAIVMTICGLALGWYLISKRRLISAYK